jgi:type IV pilus assembly protein PilV
MLLEALIAILIFSLGILTVVGIQATSIKMAADAQLRTKAALLANRLIGQMWANGGDIDTMKAAFESPDGDSYKEWLEDVCAFAKQGLPGVPCAVDAEDESGSCEGDSSSTLPEVSVNGDGDVKNGEVEITLYWRTPSMPQCERHRHIVTSQISRNPT